MLEPDRLPRIVILIDEFADLMLTTGKTVEVAVQRLAQKARAAGIHLVMATQRPSTDVITGIIKANFPSRLSYNVASRVDAGVIGLPGAENLLGRGDLLYQIGGGRITRAHGPFVSSAYVNGVVETLKSAAGPADYIELGVTENDDDETAVFDHGGDDANEDEAPGTGGQTQVSRACQFLIKALASGPRLGAELKAKAGELGIPGSTLDRAADDFLGVVKTGSNPRAPKTWSLP
jgi:DNA segregation ATPase FtsK/SpoIIIE-like protein